MSRKMLFFDIDGTLVAEGTHYLPQSAVNAIRKARENGDRKSTRLNSSHSGESRMPSSA